MVWQHAPLLLVLVWYTRVSIYQDVNNDGVRAKVLMMYCQTGVSG